MEYVNTKEKIGDIFKKPLPKDAHEYLRGKLRVIYPYQKLTKKQKECLASNTYCQILQIGAEDFTLGAV